ncbi:hypothetical protein PR048_029001 [Dryococelus australis]|uniref:Uncharacterized protein n=1 Tax=Dryococelus australis TaxID=614101 RepID=A0ABQ9GC55_9NEOP|nr:hypothetical protein PR048_029001 [Dryococelus australis]
MKKWRSAGTYIIEGITRSSPPISHKVAKPVVCVCQTLRHGGALMCSSCGIVLVIPVVSETPKLNPSHVLANKYSQKEQDWCDKLLITNVIGPSIVEITRGTTGNFKLDRINMRNKPAHFRKVKLVPQLATGGQQAVSSRCPSLLPLTEEIRNVNSFQQR